VIATYANGSLELYERPGILPKQGAPRMGAPGWTGGYGGAGVGVGPAEDVGVAEEPADVGAVLAGRRRIRAPMQGAAPTTGQPLVIAAARYGLTSLKRVPQLPSAVRVPPQLPRLGPAPANHSVSVQLWLMYSDAIQTELPSATAAP
jgi:hypothetical protein